jgi:hypothetical protein
MIQRMEQLASTFFIGALFIDELQHLNAAKVGGKDNMLNFFVNLINSIGIPVVFVGTNSMVNLFSDVMRNARRACGLGMYDFKQPTQDDAAWDMLVDAAWSYQWVQKPAALTPEIRSALYEHTQGITDFLAKLMILGQRYAIQANIETLSADTFTHVANTKMKLLKPALTILKNRDMAAMKKFEDLMPLDEQLEAMMSHQAPQISISTLAALRTTMAANLPPPATSEEMPAVVAIQSAPKIISAAQRIAGQPDPMASLSAEGWLADDAFEFSPTYRASA